MYEFQTTNQILEAFSQHDIKFQVKQMGENEVISAGFAIMCGHRVDVLFICDNSNYVAVRVFGLVSSVSNGKRSRILEMCNMLNDLPFLKYILDSDGDVNVSYDIPVKSTNNCIGEEAVEIFIHIMLLLNISYELFMTALILDDDISDLKRAMLKKLLETQVQMREQYETVHDQFEEEECAETNENEEFSSDENDE